MHAYHMSLTRAISDCTHACRMCWCCSCPAIWHHEGKPATQFEVCSWPGCRLVSQITPFAERGRVWLHCNWQVVTEKPKNIFLVTQVFCYFVTAIIVLQGATVQDLMRAVEKETAIRCVRAGRTSHLSWCVWLLATHLTQLAWYYVKYVCNTYWLFPPSPFSPSPPSLLFAIRYYNPPYKEYLVYTIPVTCT